MAKLSPEQQAQFENELNQQDGLPAEESGLSQEDQDAAYQQGQEMAAADAQAQAEQQPQGMDVPGQEQPQAPSVEEQLAQLGFGSVEDLIAAFANLSSQNEQNRELLAKLTAFQQVLQNEDDLDPQSPDYAVKKAVRDEMAPLYEKMRDDARNKLVQEAWGKSVTEMPDIEELMPDIQLYLKDNPELAISNDGLRRAYDGVRSKRYRSEKDLMNDPEFIKKAASNEKIKNAVLEAHLGEIARNGDAVPTSIGDGGGTPLTGPKKQPSDMEKAKAELLRQLGG